MPSTKCFVYSIVLAFLIAGGFPRTFSQGTAASTGIIRGKVIAPADDELTQEMIQGRELVRYQRPANGTEQEIRPYQLSEEVAVYIESTKDDPGYPIPKTHPALNQHQMMFRPLVLPVLVGTTVDFPNQDEIYHNVFSYSGPKEFDLGKYPRGHSKSVTFDKPGVVKVYCDIHTYMFATILVLTNPFFTVPENDGTYVIKDVPDGRYRLSCWYGRKKVSTETITVRGGEATVVDFVL